MTKEELAKLRKDVAGYKRESRAFLTTRNLTTPEQCDEYMRDVLTVSHHIMMAEVYPRRSWSCKDQRAANISYASEHLHESWGEK